MGKDKFIEGGLRGIGSSYKPEPAQIDKNEEMGSQGFCHVLELPAAFLVVKKHIVTGTGR